MKTKKILFTCIIILFCFSDQTNIFCKLTYENVLSSSPIEEIQPGMGYSTDTQCLAKTVCYKTETAHKSGQSSILQFEEALTFQDILKTFNLEVDLKLGWGVFSTDNMFKYFKSVEEDNYSLSINYYQKVADNMMMTFSYDPDNILTDVGKKIYNNGKNPMFRLLCGDTLVSSYEEGAVLVLSMRIVFGSKEEKDEFTTKVGVNIGSFINASTTISTTASKYNLNGQIEILAFQMGGDPTQLSKLLASSAVQCEIKNITACQETAKGLIDYVSNNFPSQFNKDSHGIWTSPLVPLASFQKDYLVSDFGLSLSPTYVNPKVERAREDLIELHNKYEYYSKNLNLLIKKYPIKLDSNFTEVMNILDDNLDILNLGDGQEKAIDCFQFPYKCDTVYSNLKSKLNLDVENRLLNLIKNMKQFSYFKFSLEKNTGMCLPKSFHWDDGWVLEMHVYSIGGDNFAIVESPKDMEYSTVSITDIGNFAFAVKVASQLNYTMTVGSSQSSEAVYSGNISCKDTVYGISESYPIKGALLNNPVYFEPYKSSHSKNVAHLSFLNFLN